ncbi:hypothetical protein SXCC_02286 [Gluconacetobacter sp. SXCC-1]|nr:hypothetical protein SXCC_02286 [Gluconacetobacter sp. SXCC-1]
MCNQVENRLLRFLTEPVNRFMQVNGVIIYKPYSYKKAIKPVI